MSEPLENVTIFDALNAPEPELYRCTECGHEQDHWSGRCGNWENHGGKEQWNTMEQIK